MNIGFDRGSHFKNGNVYKGRKQTKYVKYYKNQ